jgi:DNA invertase Pin-like site-specific DNA recombinase
MQRGERALRAPDVSADESEPTRGSHPSVRAVEVVALGYVSAPGKAQADNSDFKQQSDAIDRFCNRMGWDLVGLVRHLELNRKRPGRASLTHALERLRRGDASCLVVAELKRLCPSIAELGGVLDAVEQTGARLVSLDPAIDSATPPGREALHVLTAVSKWERDRRSEMTSAARARIAFPRIDPKLKRQITRMRGAGMTLQGIADALNEEGVPTVRGGAEWRPSSVQAALGYRRPDLRR